MSIDQDNSGTNQARQARAWAIALDPIYGLIGMGILGYAIDHWANTGYMWTMILSFTGLVVGFYRFIREAMALTKEQSKSSPKTDGDPET